MTLIQKIQKLNWFACIVFFWGLSSILLSILIFFLALVVEPSGFSWFYLAIFVGLWPITCFSLSDKILKNKARILKALEIYSHND